MVRTGQRWTAGLALAAVAAAMLTGPARPAAAAAPTAAPELVAPTPDGAVAGNPVLRWSAVPGAVKYRVQASRSDQFTSTLFSEDTGNLQYTPATDLPLGGLHWRVAATDGRTGVGPWAQSGFVKEPASQPEPTAPADYATLAYPATTPVLRWSALPAVKTYRIELDDAPDFIGATAFSTANTALALTAPLALDKDYYWRVQGVSATTGVSTSYSPARQFRMTWPELTGQPLLESPVGGPTVDVTDLVFRWSAVPGARDYQLQVSPNEDFANNTTTSTMVKGTQYSPATTFDNATYFWRVRARDTGSATDVRHLGPWSTVGVFKRSWLPQPELVTPRDGGASTGERFEWTPIARASHYEVQISRDANFSTFEAICTTYNTSVTATMTVLPGGHQTKMPPPSTGCRFALNPGTHYHWRVRGVDMPGDVSGKFSDATDFYYVPSSPPVLTGPANGSTTSAPVLTWAPVPGFSRYRVTVIRTDTGDATTTDTYATSFTPSAALAGGKVYTWFVVTLSHSGLAGIAPVPSNYSRFTFAAPAGGSGPDPVQAVDAAAGAAAPALSWQPVAGAAYYRIFSAAAGSGLFTALSEDNLYQAAFTPTTALAAGTYHWYVRAYSSVGVAAGTSAMGTFAVQALPFTAYTAPQNCVLPDCATVQPSTPELSWQPVPGAGMYRVFTALDSGFTNIVRSYTTEHTTLTPRESYLDNAAGQSYFWYVQPCVNATLCGPFQDPGLDARAQAFRKRSEPVALFSPEQDETVTDVVALGWTDYRETAPLGVGARQYRVQVATDDSFSTIVDSAVVDQTSYQSATRTYPDGVYSWRVQAIDGGEAALTFSATRHFRKVAPAPVIGTLPEPTTGLPTLTWDAMPYASGYTVEIYRGTDAAFPAGNKVLTATTRLPAFTPTSPLSAGSYSWRLRKLDPDAHPGPWAPVPPPTGPTVVPTFRVDQAAPVLTAPAAGAALATSELLFSWDPVAGAASYRFESAASAAFTTTVERRTTVMSSWAAVAGYADRVPYFWRVRVLDGADNVMATSPVRAFTKDSTGPRVLSVASAAAVAADGPLTVTFNEPVRGVTAAAFALRAVGSTVALPGTATPAAGVTGSTATFRPTAPLVPGQYYDLTVGGAITDAYGNPIGGAPTRVRVATTLESTSPALTEAWDIDAAAAASGGGYASSRRAGSTVSFTFTGGTVSVLGHVSRLGGNADVYLDGVRQTGISFYAATEAHRRVLYSRTGLADTAHTLTLRVLGTKPAAATSTAVDVDAFMAAGVTHQETSPAVRTAFARVASATATAGSYDSTAQDRDTTGAQYRFSFRGTGFTWLGTRLPTGGSATVYIDGAAAGTVSQYGATAAYRATVYRSPTLVDKVHQVRLVLTGVVPAGSRGTDVSLDAITVR